MRKFFGVTILAISLTGCDMTPKAVTSNPDDVVSLVNNVSYARDTRTNVCYAVSEFEKRDVGGKLSGGISMAAVSCEAVAKQLAN